MGAIELAARLPDVETLRRWCRALAVLDAVMSPDDWESRYWSFDPAWAPGQEMASMRNGGGDMYAIVFAAEGVLLRGFDHESPLSPWSLGAPAPGLLERVPPTLHEHVVEPAFGIEAHGPDITVCLWRLTEDDRWQAGIVNRPDLADADDGSDWLFEELDGNPATYVAFAAWYYEVSLDPSMVEAVSEERPLTDAVILALNAEADPTAVRDEVAAMGYPVAG